MDHCMAFLTALQGVYRHKRIESYILLSEVITQHAAAAWAHINVLGEYDFSDEKLRDALEILLLKSGV